jgi:hypothetical protein
MSKCGCGEYMVGFGTMAAVKSGYYNYYTLRTWFVQSLS